MKHFNSYGKCDCGNYGYHMVTTTEYKNCQSCQKTGRFLDMYYLNTILSKRIKDCNYYFPV